MLRYSHDPMFLKLQNSVLEDFGGENCPRRHSLYQFMLAQDRFRAFWLVSKIGNLWLADENSKKIDMRKHDKNYKFDAEKFFQQMEERYGSYDSGMNVFRRDTEFFRQRQTFSYQEQGSPDWLNFSLMAWFRYRDLGRDLRKNTFQMNIKMVMARMLNCMESCLKKFFSSSGLVCDHF